MMGRVSGAADEGDIVVVVNGAMCGRGGAVELPTALFNTGSGC
jgi:hypothetical protein